MADALLTPHSRQFLIDNMLLLPAGLDPYRGTLGSHRKIATDEKLSAVFRSRAAELNLEEAAIAKASLEAFKKIFQKSFD